ncbi:hypothetical protein PV08_11127 [Exophiala spinifera]|uniref:MOSC domain-containing protein n=1 Tax=Exophiala spinifera TaxID=91928 RepID=A0A0D1Y5F7_9EURO|nr:uncharacterized protein PV08_11127 [Exophiala spinifera]KIW10166.1 hypothetical protein PV08_11127 [Exophiala spinifera]
MTDTTTTKMHVKQLYTYPIKSLRGISLPSFSAMYTGFPHDRRFMLYKVDGGENMHVSKQTEMCLFTTAFDDPENPTKVVVKYSLDHTFDRPEQKVSADDLSVSLTPDTADLDTVEITMHSSPCVGFDVGSSHNKWFSDRFGYEVKLLYIGSNRRKVLGNMPPGVAGPQQDTSSSTPASASAGNGNGGNGWLGSLRTATATASSLVTSLTGSGSSTKTSSWTYDGVDEGISFADVAPYLVVSETSWRDAQRRLPDGEVMDISKFRPNIIVEGAESEWDEDFWAELRVGSDAKLVLTQNCARCNSLNVDYATGKVGAGEAGKILKKLQKDRRVDPGAKWSPVFGRYGFLAKVPEGKSAAEIKVGDQVTLLKRNSERTRFGKSLSIPLSLSLFLSRSRFKLHNGPFADRWNPQIPQNGQI